MSAPRPDRSLPPRRLPLLAVVALLAACDAASTATAPDPSPLRLVAASALTQRGLPAMELPLPLVVRVVDGAGEPAVGTGVRFRAGAGSGTVTAVLGVTNSEGLAIASWTLGSRPVQEVVASADGGAGEVTFTATLLPREEADLVTATGNVNADAAFVAYDAGAFDALDTFQGLVSDSIVILPFATPAARDEVVAFTRGRPPLLLSPVAWTAGRDTLRIDFPEPIAIAITIWIVKGPFEQQAETARTHARIAEEVWERAGMGVRFSEVDVRDATDHPRAAEFHGRNGGICTAGVKEAIGSAVGRLNVYYVGGVSTYAGYACTNFVLMAEQSGRYRNLLAHEIGHTFGLAHDLFGGSNVMNPNPGTGLTAGQIFHAHFQSYSALNRIYRAYPSRMQRDCRWRVDGTPVGVSRACMPASFDLH